LAKPKSTGIRIYIDKREPLTDLDIIKCVEKAWNYVVEGILALGAARKGNGELKNYLFFPYLHLTEKEKKITER